MQVLFPNTQVAKQYTCAGVDLYVKSVRWSFTRYQTEEATLGSAQGDKATLPTNDCIARGTCRELDATVWLVPRCGQDRNLNSGEGCTSTATCIPFCMAARSAGSGRDNLVLASAARWRKGLTVLGQDCVSATAAGNAMGQKGSVSRAESGGLGTNGVAVHGFSYNSAVECRRVPRMTSVIDKPTGARVGSNVGLTGQPFVITGDTLMTEVELGGGALSVQAERLEGSEVDIFSLNGMNQQLPAHPRALVPLQQKDLNDPGKLTVPYTYQTARVAATNSRNYVFYASNPPMDVFGAYFSYCHIQKTDKSRLGKMGLLIMSSYSPIRVYRVSAYRRCAAYSCGADLVRYVTIDGFSLNFTRSCDEVFNVRVAGLEYLNEDNVAVIVQSSRVDEYNEKTGEFSGGNTRNKVLWLNPATMRVQDSVWQTAVPSSSYAVLCPALQRLPRMGSFGGELVNSVVFLLKYTVFSILYTPGMVPVWRYGGVCPQAGGSMYHSVLGGCGGGLYSLDDFFDSLDDAAALFWHSLSLTGQLIASPSDGTPAAVITGPLTDVLDGMSQYGQGTVDLWSAGASVLTLTRVPIKEQMTNLWATVQAGTSGQGLQGLAFGGSGVVSWSRYSYKAISVIGVDLVRRVLDPVTFEKLTVAAVFKLIWANLYDLNDEFSSSVTGRTRMGCGGLRLMFGLDNPWSELIYQQCMAAAELTGNLKNLALNIFVQVPMAKCVCKDSAGQNVATFAAQVCAPSLPVSLVPTLLMIVNEVATGKPVCERVLGSVRTSISQSMDSWFVHQSRSLDALGSSVDYATASFDQGAGRCLDFQHDPHVVVIVPWPVDYFQHCSRTSRCKEICSAEWKNFQEAMAPPVSQLPPLSVSMESMFFPGEPDPELVLENAQASVELASSSGTCFPRAGPADFALAVAETSWPAVAVRYWCAPRMPSLPVYKSDALGYGADAVPGTLLDIQFGDASGEWLAMLLQLDQHAQEVQLLNRTGLTVTPALDAALPSDTVLMRVTNLWIIGGTLLVDLVTRRMQTDSSGQSARSQSGVMHVSLDPLDPSRNGWSSTDVNLVQYGNGQYWYTRLGSETKYLFLPKNAGLHAHQVRFWVSGSTVRLLGSTLQAPTDLSSLSGASLSPCSQDAAYVFATTRSGWDWLKQVRWGQQGRVFGSASINLNIQIKGNCNERGCEGCKSVAAQRLCLAYNKCALINCVGTPVHQRRPLCGVGGLLRQVGGMALTSTQAAWSVLSETLGLTLQLSLMSMREARLLWPEDAFLCFVCQAKDSSAEFFSILTATLNSALQMGGANIGYMYGGASNIDTNADAVLTISSTALNAFMHQLALLPLYGLIAIHQIMMCQASGVLALLSASGFTLRLTPSSEASAADSIAGQCLTVGAETLANFPSDNPGGLGYTVTSIASNAVQLLLIQTIEPFLHFLDAGLAYLMGVVHTLGVWVMSQSMAKCNPPDFFLQDVVRCACNDHRLQIPSARRAETALDGALWCSGVLSMIDSNNQPYYVYNPYSYAQLQAMSSGLDNYTRCVSDKSRNGYACEVPNDPFFRTQGVTAVNVLVKCRDNFIKKRWDPAAYVFYQEAFHHLLKRRPSRAEYALGPDPRGVRACLQDSKQQRGSLAQACLQEFFSSSGVLPELYWAYEQVPVGREGPEFTDACQTFTGPAETLNLTDFASCVDGIATGETCRYSGHIWSPLSDNNVAVAEQHTVISHGVRLDGLVQLMYKQASEMVLEAVDASMAARAAGANQPPIELEFFSVEGDVLHQTMDCIFMGPYSRVDYWPIPVCEPDSECLVGPYWARDEAMGGTRQVDAGSCPTESSLPYTCGSPARKSLMRYLVKDILPGGTGVRNKNATVANEIIVLALSDIRADWNDTRNFGCDCGNGLLDPLCCPANATAELLPPGLQKPFTQIKSDHVLQVLAADMSQLYDMALEGSWVWQKHMSLQESAKYNWSQKERVREEARFNPRKPVTSYTSEAEAASPLIEQGSSLWDVCHAALKQVFFTMPTRADGKVRMPVDMPEFDGDPRKLQDYVKGFLAAAWEDSPLYRHYSPRHAPTQSHMCAQPTPEAESDWDGEMGYSDMLQQEELMLDGSELPYDIPVFHAQRFRVGGLGRCLCGWAKREGRCYVPQVRDTAESVCKTVQCTVTDQKIWSYSMADEGPLWKAFSPSWFCPEFELSPHWGFTDASTAEDWLGRNLTDGLLTSSRDLLTHGRAGVRLGNVNGLSNLAKKYLNPTTRQVPLERGRLTTCARPLSETVEDLAQEWLDELFPAAQAVEEAGAAAYCLRYTIELAKLEIFRLVERVELEAALVQQKQVVAVWQRRCGAQLHLMHLCVSLGVYKPLMDWARTAPVCAHFQHVESRAPGRVIYTTPQCLVSVDGVFYDPCRCMSCSGEGINRVLSIPDILQQGEACRLRWDPRQMLTQGAPIGWLDGMHPLADDAPGSRPFLLREEFAREILEDSDAVGNGPHKAGGRLWWEVDGPMHETGEFCDGVLDWWPEEWIFPVGYHVTVPCGADETAYRSFMQAFAFDEDQHVLVYQHDLLRNKSLADTHSGVGGLCRSNNFGMPVYETNNMRYCTQVPDQDTQADFTIPLTGEDPEYTGAWSAMACTTSSSDLPWPDSSQQAAPGGLYQAAHYSVGTVPNMPDESAGTYPASEEAMFATGPWREVQTAGDSWGAGARSCEDFELLLCKSTDDPVCPVGYNCRGMVCTGNRTQSCSSDQECSPGDKCRGICMDKAVECTRHSMCGEDRMCSGLGVCVQPVLAVQNRLLLSEENVSFSLATAGDCLGGGREYSLLGASYWGNTGQDLLRVHGMCSAEDWFKYTQVYTKAVCSTLNEDGYYELNPAQCLTVKLDMPSINQSKWWLAGRSRPEIMYLRPTNCDRDYERLQGFKQCAPDLGQATLVSPESQSKATEYDRFVRLHMLDEARTIPIARMPETDNISFGFLGLSGGVRDIKQLGTGDNPLVSCASVAQCYPGPFTVDGVSANRSSYNEETKQWSDYPLRTPFTCGAFGLEDPGGLGCKLDLTVLPLYRFLCSDQALASCKALMPYTVNTMCSNVQYQYEASNQDRITVLSALRDLFDGFPSFSSVDEYLRVTACATDMYDKLAERARASPSRKSSLGLYFPMMFSLYEFPFDWFYQCIMLAGVRINEESHRQQDCRAYKQRGMRTIDSYTPISPDGDSYDTYLKQLRGGYTRGGYDAYRTSMQTAAQNAVVDAMQRVKTKMYGNGSEDQSYPQCSENMLWTIGDYGEALPDYPEIPDLRALIWNWNDKTEYCAEDWHSAMIKDLPDAFGFTMDNWIDRLTYPDPVNLVPQDGVTSQTMLTSVANYMLDSMDVSTQTVSIGVPGCLRFNNNPPVAYDQQRFPLDEALKPAKSGNAGSTTIDETVGMTCAFSNPAIDPAFAGRDATSLECKRTNRTTSLGGSSFKKDTLWECNHRECSKVPMLVYKDGKFNCRYVPAGGVITGECTENSEGCHSQVLAAVYSEMLGSYEPDPVHTLRPELFPWFRTNAVWEVPFDAFDLTPHLDYAQNIQPDPERAVMCELTDEDKAIQFSECSSPHYKRLKDHIEEYYKHEGAVVVPSNTQLEWPIHRKMLAQGVILSFTNLNRSMGGRFMDSMFDDKTVCKDDASEQVCWKKGVGEFVPMNPWLLGNFNPFEVCDVDFTDAGEGGREYIYSSCVDGNDYCSSYFKSPIPGTCKAHNNELVRMQGVQRFVSGSPLEYNLCSHKLDEDPEGCLHDQSMLGGFDGDPVGAPGSTSTTNHIKASNLYESSKWVIPENHKGGLFSGNNPLWRGGSSPYGYLQINEDDIGGHRIELSVSRVNESTDLFSVLGIERIPLSTEAPQRFFTRQGPGKPIADWVASLRSNMLAEDAEVSGLYSKAVKYGPNNLGASCPLQRWVFYSGEYDRFSPPIPSATRASYLFHRIHQGWMAHPTMQRAPANTFLGVYRTSNGFCACPRLDDIDQPQCLIPTGHAEDNPCSLDRTVEQLKGLNTPLRSYVFIPRDHNRVERRCSMQLDWPNVDGTLRDGLEVAIDWAKASNPSHRKCHVLDRFAPFKYRYTSADTLVPLQGGGNTLSSGACKTGRLVTWAKGLWSNSLTRCLRESITDSNATFQCTKPNPDGNANTLNRRRRLSLRETLTSRAGRKQRCSACSPPPGFVSEGGRPIPAESSFGRLVRPASVEAMLAKDLREALCSAGQGGACNDLNASGWRRGEFMRNYMLHPARLFSAASGGASASSSASTASKSKDAQQWQGRPWVYCPTTEALKTGEGCVGTMTRAQWEGSKTSMCQKMVHSFSRENINGSDGEPMAKAPFCVLDNTTDRVCKAVADAKVLVRQANCIAKGVMSCMPSPFVYHPASYEPSNNAWVHDTVKAYYKQVNKDACPTVTASDTGLLEFARAKQRECPANAVNLMEKVLLIVRLVVTDVALLLTSMASLVFRAFGLLFSSGVSDMKSGIRANWLYIKSKGSAMLSASSDLLVDAMLNSGELGARILGFLDNTCNKINAAISWFMNVWCSYVQKYMIQVLLGLRNAIGMIASGFEMVQDFVDEIFKGILPASFVAKYANQDFKQAMQERYSQPTEHKDKVAAAKNVPKDVHVNSGNKQALNTAGKNSAWGRARNTIGRIANGPIGKVLRVAGPAMAAWEMLNFISGITDAVVEESLRKLWPSNFTLFDFSMTVNILDDMEQFLLDDASCYTFEVYKNAGVEYETFLCLKVNMDSLTSNGSTAGTTSLDATRCWATASPSLGQNSIYSCTASSTCCETSECARLIPCGTCPAPQLPDTNLYGCESLQEKCMCGRVKTSTSKCTANSQCGLESECEMVSSLDGVSYGTMPCKSCPSQRLVICLLPDSGMPAKCACMLNKGLEFDLCGDMVGTKTPVDNTRMCGYLPDQSPLSTRWAFQMEDLIVLPCIRVAQGVCSTVYSTSGASIRMVVAASIRASSSSGRRLLMDEAIIPEPGPPVHHVYESEYELVDTHALHALLTGPGWNTTAAPCSSLALAYQAEEPLGVLETFTLHKCAYWRYVGQRVIQRYNLTEAMSGHDTFLLSVDDLVYALMTPGVPGALMGQPSLIGAVMLYHPWLKPLRALGVAVANHLEHMAWIRDIDSEAYETLFGDDEEDIIAGDTKRTPRFPDQKEQEPGQHGGRRLLSVQDTIQGVLAYSGQVIRGAEARPPGSVVGAWSTAAFTWPPRYDYSLRSCPIALSTLSIGRQVLLVNKLYFEHFGSPPPPMDRSLRATLPGWDWVDTVRELPTTVQVTSKSWASAAFHWLLSALSIQPSHFVAFFTMDQKWSLEWILQTSVQCDLVAVMTCSRHDKDLIMSSVVFILLYAVLRLIAGVMGLGFLSTLFLFSYPGFILWYSFGMAPTCFPMVPTCLLGDIISAVGQVVPEAILFPKDLLCHPSEAGMVRNQTCLRSCEEIGFSTWIDPLAFAVCDTDPRTCSYLHSLGDTGLDVIDNMGWADARAAMLRFARVVSEDGSRLAAHRLCTWVSFVTVTPVLALVVLVAVLANAVVGAALDLFPSLVAFVCQAYIFHRS